MSEIPPIADPLGKYWEQPSPDLIEVDETHALMTACTLKKLLEYSSSIPSGVYDGKMWRRHCGGNRWLLCWYGPSINPNECSINSREVLIA